MTAGAWKQRRKSVFVTGAARGIGRETARQLVAAGYDVALVDLLADEVEEAAAALGERALPLVADVTDQASLADAAAQAARRFGGIDAVVANAGIADLSPVLTGDRARQQRMLDNNLAGVLDS